MKLYVAGKWNDKVEIRGFMDRLVAKGHTITEDWTRHPSGAKTNDLLRADAKADLQGIEDADVVVAAMTDPKYEYRGTFFELGYALGLKKKIIVMAAPDRDARFRSVAFFHLVTEVGCEHGVFELLEVKQ